MIGQAEVKPAQGRAGFVFSWLVRGECRRLRSDDEKGKILKDLKGVFLYIGNVEFSIAPFVFEGFLALALFFIFFLALDAKPRERKDL
jgi:hypothetical protein